MFKYENTGKFVIESVDYPFNIVDKNNIFIMDFWIEINKLIHQINNENLSKIRFIWIDAGCYCQTEIFLRKILSKNKNRYPVLYLHWLDFANSNRSVYHQLSQEQIDNEYFINDSDKLKICVIDHAETIDQMDEYLELCRKLYDNKCIFIFVFKTDTPALSYWESIVKAASASDDACYLGILRSEENYFMVKPYSDSQCKDIISRVIAKEDIKCKAISMIDTIGDELRRPYYFDFLINELNNYEDISQMPEKLDDTDLIFKIFNNSLEGIIAHLKGYMTLKEYLDGYYDSFFVKNFTYGEHSRIPFDNYVWAYGIMHCIGKDRYEDVISTQFSYTNTVGNIDFKTQLEEINARIVSLFYSEKKWTINNNFLLKEYFMQMIMHSLDGSRITAFVINKFFDKIDLEICISVFKALGERYNKTLKSKEDIHVHYMLGMEIGMLLPKLDNDSISEGLEYLFECVNDDYVEPKCNDNGISVIPVTNFEFEKFVSNKGYDFYSLDSDKALYEIATEYYKEIFDFIIGALSGSKRKDSNCLARLLRGYGWEHYKQIAYLLSRKEDINNAAIYKAIGINYPEKLSYPAKWVDSINSDVSRPFCNPLQPVVCINLFEARAYAKWLSSKICKPVRILNYDPDYLSVIGNDEEDVTETLRHSFLSHIENKRDFINSAENNTLFYCKNDIKVKEPSPVAMPNSKFLELYDFIGNIFEMQDTPFIYNYAKNSEEIRKELKKIKEAFIDYNCPGGGLQRTAANWPPEYMGQVPAFLRNQDLGFRIVIGGHNVGSREHKSKKLEYTNYSESIVETYNCIDEDNLSILSHIHLDYTELNNEFERNFLRSPIFCNSQKSAMVYTQKNIDEDVCKESILLVQEEDSIFAYHLISIASIFDNKKRNKSDLEMIVRKSIVPKDLVARKKLQNRSYSEWINMVEIINDGIVDIYIAYPINILNGYFKISNRKVRYTIRDGQEYKKHSVLSGSYLICFNSESQKYKREYYDSFKEKLGVDFFLPDWIDIVDFINNICINMSITNTLDIETVMAAITTIDTADLHEQINKKILNKKG